MDSLQLIVTVFVALGVFKILYMLLNKEGMNKFIKSYYRSMSNRPWLYHNIYMALAIGILYCLRKYGMSYTQIVGVTAFMGFMINAAYTSYPRDMFENLTLDKINWKRLSILMILWLYLMAKALQEIFFTS